MNHDVKCIQHDGQAWIYAGNRIIAYIDKNGSILFNGDVVACGRIPPMPTHDQKAQKDGIFSDNDK